MFQSASKTFVVPSRLLETSWLVFDDSMQYFLQSENCSVSNGSCVTVLIF